uniref:Uncharacterized protein n=1 Tax=Octopus bimaculoides TaxID=37653 RepID=A0A0L8FUE1_OCTBM
MRSYNIIFQKRIYSSFYSYPLHHRLFSEPFHKTPTIPLSKLLFLLHLPPRNNNITKRCDSHIIHPFISLKPSLSPYLPTTHFIFTFPIFDINHIHIIRVKDVGVFANVVIFVVIPFCSVFLVSLFLSYVSNIMTTTHELIVIVFINSVVVFLSSDGF